MLSSILAAVLLTQTCGQCARPAPVPPVAAYAPYQADYVPPRQAAYTPPNSPVVFAVPVNAGRPKCGRHHRRARHARCCVIVPACPCGIAGNAR